MGIRDWFDGRGESDLTEGGIAEPLFHLSLPIVATKLLQTAYNLADTFWLGQYSTNALAAISFGFPMVYLFISLGMGISVAGSVLVAQNVGADDRVDAEYAALQSITFAIITSVGLGAIGYFVVDDLLRFFGASPAVLPLATAYMRVISVGLVFMFGFFTFVALMRGAGDTITPMLVMFGSVVLNIVLDPFVIFGWGPFPELGIMGAALATVFSRGLAFLVGVGIMVSGTRGIQIHVTTLWPDVAFARRIVRIGTPATVEGVGRSVAANLLLLVVGLFSTPVVAAYGIVTRVLSIVFMPAIAVSRGVETMTGQNIGAREYDRAAETNAFAARVMLVLLASVGVGMWIFAHPIVAVFTTDPAVVTEGVVFVRYVAPTFGFMGVMRAYNGGFRGAGKTLTAAAISVTALGIVRLPVAWQGAVTLGSRGIWIGFAVSNVIGALVAYLWFRRGSWRRSDLSTDSLG